MDRVHPWQSSRRPYDETQEASEEVKVDGKGCWTSEVNHGWNEVHHLSIHENEDKMKPMVVNPYYEVMADSYCVSPDQTPIGCHSSPL